MFSYLCRACLSDFKDPLDIVPLFESYQNVYYYRLCNTLQLSLEENDKLPQNVCKNCAEQILKFHKFRLTYKESERKLYDMLEQSLYYENSVEIEGPGSIVQTSLKTSDSKWKCNECSAGFEKRFLLKEHIKRLHCFNKINNLSSTVKKQNRNGKECWKCTHCSAEFRTRQLKYEHQKEHYQNDAPIKPSEVTDGDYDSDLYENDDFQISNITEIDVHENSYDQDEFKFIPEYVKTETTDLGLYIVEKCSEFGSFDDRQDYKSNGLMFSDMETLGNNSGEECTNKINDKWKCKKCSECFGTRDSLSEHNRLHSITKNVRAKKQNVDPLKDTKPSIDDTPIDSRFRWKCVTCLCTFQTRDLLRAHRQTVHLIVKAEPKERQCNFCLAIFSTRQAYRDHRRIEHPKVRKSKSKDLLGSEYTCEICNKIFSTKLKIQKHMETHRDKERKKRLCTVCGLKFCSTSNLNIHHRLVHSRERKFHCTLCDCRFSRAHRLRTHMNRHEGLRPFACSSCDKSFYDKGTLRVHHQIVHLKLKPHDCQICSKTFHQKNNLKAHLLNAH